MVDKEEMMNYLVGGIGMTEKSAVESTEMIFKNIDVNGDGELSIDEFADSYIKIVWDNRKHQI